MRDVTTKISWPLGQIAAAIVLALTLPLLGQSRPEPASLKFEISFPASVHATPMTGRAFVMITRKKDPEPRLQAGSWGDAPPFFGLDVEALKPAHVAVIDASTPGYTLRSLREVPAGDYYVQALLNVYTEFHRSDGHTIWAHMDQWEGQQFNQSPGNLYSDVSKVHLDPAKGYAVHLETKHVIAPVKIPPDTHWVKHIKIRSKLLSNFWGQPMFLGATVFLPKDYDQHPDSHYPVIYEQGHFGLQPPLFMQIDAPDNGSKWNTIGYAG